MEYEIITEANLSLKIPKIAKTFRGPGSKLPGFYNPEMAFSRDVAIFFLGYILNKWGSSGFKLLDALAGSGSRGLRYKKTFPETEVHLNDISSKAVEIIKENAKLNKLEVIVHNKDFNILASEKKFDYIDLDPYGSPVHFTDALFRGLKARGFAAITATDTAALFGTYKRVVLRRYGSINFRNMFSKEAGVRILIHFLLREAGKWDYAVFPHLAYANSHHVRVHISAIRSATKADEIIKKYVGYVIFHEDGSMEFSRKAYGTYLGPLWIGPIFDLEFLDFMKKHLRSYPTHTIRKLEKMLEIWHNEGKINAPYYNIHELAKMYNIKQTPKINKIVDTLRDMGYEASRTHFDPLCIKTNAPIKDIIYASRENSPCI
ncbi:MAG TPA: hypothetical protein ENI59_00345 [Euryarchaeota archaeon]|nr:hypothetical protein [Euryarchaeota archaeon]